MRRRTRTRVSPLLAGVLTLAACLVGVYFAQVKAIPFRHHREVRVAFRNLNGLRPGAPVRMAGVVIGKVTGSRAYGDRAALVTLRLTDAGVALHRDATFKIRPRLFLEGNFFVDVRPGTPSAPLLRDGAVVPVQQTATPVQFDQVLSILDSDTRDEVKVVLDQLGRALSSSAKAVNRTYRYTGPAYKAGAVVSDAQLGERPGQLGDLVDDSGQVAAAFDRDPRALQDLIVGLYRTSRGFARADGSLDRALGDLPRTLDVALPTLAALNRAFPPLRRFLADLRPTLRSSVPALDATLPLTRQLRALVAPPELQGLSRELRAATPDLVRGNRASLPLAEQTRLNASCLNGILIPWSQDRIPDAQFPAKAQIYEEGARTLVGLASESRSGDANGTWFRTMLAGGNHTYQLTGGRLLTSALPIMGVNPPAPVSIPPLRADVPCETQQRPDLRSIPGPPPAAVPTSATSPATLARSALAQRAAVSWLQQQLAREGLAGSLRLTDKPLTPALLTTAAG